MKNYHDQKIEKREFAVGDLVLLFNSRLRLFLGKLKSKWTRKFIITKLFPVDWLIWRTRSVKFTVNGKRIKIYLWHAKSVHEIVEAYVLDEVVVIKDIASCRDVKSSASSEANQGVSSIQQYVFLFFSGIVAFPCFVFSLLIFMRSIFLVCWLENS